MDRQGYFSDKFEAAKRSTREEWGYRTVSHSNCTRTHMAGHSSVSYAVHTVKEFQRCLQFVATRSATSSCSKLLKVGCTSSPQ